MRTIKISDEVWDVIAKDGKFGETADDVLRRLLKVSGNTKEKPIAVRAWKERRATVRMTQHVGNNKLVLRFDSGATFSKSLPPKDNHSEIRRVRDAAIEFVKKNGGTLGQEHAAIRALTSRGYHVTRQNNDSSEEFI
jgi:negative regulator of replication initiation